MSPAPKFFFILPLTIIKMRIRSKLLVNTLITLICLAAVGGVGFYYTHHVAQVSLSLLETDAEPILKLNTLEQAISEKWLHLIVHSGTSDLDTMQQFEQEIATQIQAIVQKYALDDMENAKHLKTLQMFQKNWQIFQKIAQQVLSLSQDFTKEDALRLIVQEGRVAYDKTVVKLRDLVKQHTRHMEELRDTAFEARQNAAVMIAVLTFVIGLVALILISRLTQKIVIPLLSINDHLKSLAQGEPVENDIKYTGTDEIAEIVLSARQLKENMNDTMQQANAIAGGNYSKEIKLRSERDQLGQALYDMTHTLREVTVTNDRQTWLKSGQTQLHDQMSGDLTLSDLAHNIVSSLTLYVEGQVGICYLVKQSTEGLNQTFRMKQIASYAYTRRKNMGDEFEFSEGLIERAAKGQKRIIISIEAGLDDDEMPRYLLMFPFLHENVVKGVIVLGSSNVLTTIQQDFLDQVMPSIGIAVNSVEARTKMQALLKETQKQAEELDSQRAILQHTNQQLNSQQEDLERKQAELQQSNEELQSQSEELQTQQEELQQTNEELETRTKELERQKAYVQQKNTDLEMAKKEVEKARTAIETKAQEVELASKYKSEFLANMSHELRTPLNSMLILGQLLMENKKGNLTEKQVEYAKTIHSAGSDLLTLINEILDLSKVEAGKIEMQTEEVILADLMKAIDQKFCHVAENKGVTFHLGIGENVPQVLSTDGQRLKQIINNLLSNAFKFTSEGKNLLMLKRVTNLPQDVEMMNLELESDKTITISVTDTGIGIPKDKQQVIFEAFQQVDGTTSRKYGGTGLGLPISRQLARLLGGELTLETEEGKGSTFTLYLPFDEEKQEQINEPANFNKLPPQDIFGAQNNQAHEIPVISNKKESLPTEIPKCVPLVDDRDNLQPTDRTILIVEDDRKFSGILMDLTHEKGLKYIIAEDGKTALELVEKYHPNAILLDVGLPQLDGWSVMERLKENPETRHIPVHFLSAADEGIDAKKMGAIGYLHKPVSMELLGDAFKKIEEFISSTVKYLLVVTDHDARKKKILALTENADVKTTVAETVNSALQNLKSASFDCIILDADIEEGTGCKLLGQMQKEANLSQIPVIIYAERDLTQKEETLLRRCAKNLPIKSVSSPERLVDETALFLHQIESKLPENQRNMIRMVHDKETIFKDKKVLIADDDVRNVFALATVLEDKDMEIVAAKNGKECLVLLDKHDDISLVLMDIMMPEMDGYEAMQAIRKHPKYHNIPILALTAKAMKGDKAKCIEAGANDYLSKPVDTNKLLSLMRVWLYR
jgi:signal transduction histidine kinase/DNA-binding response OmpR family regulator